MFVGVGASRVRDLFEQAKANAPGDRLRRRDRRRRPAPRRRPRRRARRARADPQPAARRDGRLRRQGRRHPDRRDQPARHPRPGAAASGPVRPADRGRPARTCRAARASCGCTPAASRSPRTSTSTRSRGGRPASPAPTWPTSSTRRALLTARSDRKLIDDGALEESIDRVMAGPERKRRVMSDKEKKIIAYHEGGHALVAHALPNTDPVHKVTILPRGRALGYTMALPDGGQVLRRPARDARPARLCCSAAAPPRSSSSTSPTTGAANDIEKATVDRPRRWSPQYGMSERLGAVKFGERQRRAVPRPRHGPPARLLRGDRRPSIDEEVRRLIEAAHDEAWEILVEIPRRARRPGAAR